MSTGFREVPFSSWLPSRNASDYKSESKSESESEEQKMKSPVNSKQQELPKKKQQQQRRDEGGSNSEYDTDTDSEPESRYSIVKRDKKSKLAPGDGCIPGKRRRDATRGKGAQIEESFGIKKRKKAVKDGQARYPPERRSSPSKSPARKGGKAEQAMRGTKVPAAEIAEKAKGVPAAMVENTKSQATNTKRKSAKPPSPGTRPQAQKVEIHQSSPLRPKKPDASFWTHDREEFLINELHKDYLIGLRIPDTTGHPYWESLLKRLSVEEDLTELQVCEKVRRMRIRYRVLEEKAKEPKAKGGRFYKSRFEQLKLFPFWAEMWGPETKASQPDSDEEDSAYSDDVRAAADVVPPVAVSNCTVGKDHGEDSSSAEENEEEEADIVKRRTADLNQIHVATKVIPEQVVISPFIPKPRLEFTPLLPEEQTREVLKKYEEGTNVDGRTEAVPARDDGKKEDVVSLADQHLKRLKDEMYAFFHDLRGTCFQAMEKQRNGIFTAELGNFALGGIGLGFPGMLEGLCTSSGSQAALQKKWREHKIKELSLLSELLSERQQLMQEQCRLQQEELKLQNQKLEQEWGSSSATKGIFRV